MTKNSIGIYYDLEQEIYFVDVPGTKYGAQLRIPKDHLPELGKVKFPNFPAKLDQNYHFDIDSLTIFERDQGRVCLELFDFVQVYSNKK